MAQGIDFLSHEHRIRYFYLLFHHIYANYYDNRCFPHIINLAVQAVLGSITNMSYAREDGEQFNRWQSTTHDVVALLRTLINKVLSFFCPNIYIYTYLNV